jgi:hypothetical protein
MDSTRVSKGVLAPAVMGDGRVRAAVVAVLLALVGAFGALPAANAHEGPLIQPGAEVWGRWSALGHFGPCSLNFVFRDKKHTYIGAGARCLHEVGERAAMANREFGTVVYYVGEGQTAGDEFALIRVDESELHRVSPVVLGVNFAPTGVKTSDETAAGNVLYMTGQGAGFRESQTQHRAGVLVSDNERKFEAAIPTSLGDGGAPVLDQAYNAYGVMSSSLNPNGGAPYGITVERILHLLDGAGFKVELVTGYDDNVRGGR